MPLSTEALVEHSARHLKGLNRSKQIADFARQNPQMVETFMLEFDFAVNLLNEWFGNNSTMLHFAPKAHILQPLLGNPPIRLPTITEMRKSVNWVPFFNRGLREERNLLLAGEADTQGKLSGSKKILFSSFDNSNPAYLLGGLVHTWERTCVAALRQEPPSAHVWQKDELLIPVEDVVILLGQEAVPNIYRLMTTPPNPENGGVGWITPERIALTHALLGI